MSVDSATPAERTWIRQRYAEAFAHLHPWWERWLLARRLPRSIDEQAWVWRCADGPVGFGLARRALPPGSPFHRLPVHPTAIDEWRRDDPYTPLLTGAWWAIGMVVVPARRREGIGRALAVARIEAARAAGAPAVVVNCIVGAGADALYDQLGFRPVALLPDGYGPGIAMRVRLLPFRTPPATPAS